MTRRSRLLTTLGALLALAPASAGAAPTTETEPNDALFQINGPVGIDGAEGQLQTAGDVDRFLVRLRPQRQVTVTYTLRSSCTYPGDARFSLTTPGGSSIGAPSDGSSFYQSTRSYTITTPGVFGGPAVDYFLTFRATDSDAVGCAYKFAITGVGGASTDVIDPAAGPAYPIVAVPEPNDTLAQAFGPLAGDTLYQGKIDTANDPELMVVPGKAGTGLTFELAASSGDARVGIFDQARYTEGGSNYSEETLGVDDGEVDTTSVSVGTADRQFVLKVTGDLGAEWRLRVTPPSSIGSTPPPPPTPAPTPTVEPISRTLSISRVSGRYRGRVYAAQSSCYSKVVVSLRRRGKSAVYSSATTRTDGSWTIRRSALPGKVYAQVTAQTRSSYACGAAESGTLRRR